MHCHFTVSYGRACTREGGKEFGDLAFCWQHKDQLIHAISLQLAAEHLDHGRTRQLRCAVEATLDEVARTERWERDAARVKDSVVYFVERDAWIKIGFTAQLAQRLASLPQNCRRPDGMTIGPVTVLATMPGNRGTEHRLHAKFEAQRVRGTEWFHPSDELRQYIARHSNQD